MTEDLPPLPHEHWSHPLEDIDAAIVQWAAVCGVSLDDPWALERVLRRDPLVCTHENPQAQAKLRSLLMMHYVVAERAIEALGADEMRLLTQALADRLRQRFGPHLGGMAAQALESFPADR